MWRQNYKKQAQKGVKRNTQHARGSQDTCLCLGTSRHAYALHGGWWGDLDRQPTISLCFREPWDHSGWYTDSVSDSSPCSALLVCVYLAWRPNRGVTTWRRSLASEWMPGSGTAGLMPDTWETCMPCPLHHVSGGEERSNLRWWHKPRLRGIICNLRALSIYKLR